MNITKKENYLNNNKRGYKEKMDKYEVSIDIDLPRSILDQLGIKPNTNLKVKEQTDFNKIICYNFIEGYGDFEL